MHLTLKIIWNKAQKLIRLKSGKKNFFFSFSPQKGERGPRGGNGQCFTGQFEGPRVKSKYQYQQLTPMSTTLPALLTQSHSSTHR